MAERDLERKESGAGHRALAKSAHQPLLQLTWVRLLEFWREPEAIFWVFVFPVLLAFALGIAFRSSPETRYRVGMVQPQGTELGQTLDEYDAIELVALDDAAQAARALRTGAVDVVVRPQEGDVVFRFDPARAESRAARLAVDAALQAAAGVTPRVAIREEPVEASGSRYIDFLIPGLIGLNLMGSGMWGIGFSVVQNRNRKLLKLFAATPMRRPHYLLGFVLSRLVFLVAEVVALVVFGWLVFGVQVHGSIAALAVVSLIGALSFSGLALLVAARPESIEVVSGWMNFIMLPMWLLSGSFFSYERFPDLTEPFIRALPLTAVNDALRAIMNDGASLFSTLPELGILTAWGGISFVLAMRYFKWR